MYCPRRSSPFALRSPYLTLVHRFFVELPLIEGQEVELPADVAHQVGRVLRLRPGATIVLLDGSGHAFPVELTALGTGRATGRAGASRLNAAEPVASLGLFIGPEGGFTPGEIAAAEEHGIVPVTRTNIAHSCAFPTSGEVLEVGTNRGMVKLDLHLHTHHSRDCTIPTAEVIRLCLRRGLDGIAVTDHNTLAGGLEAAALAPPGFTVIPGEEITSSEGEIIGLFLGEEIAAGLSPEETAWRIREQGGVIIVPHPFDPLRRSPLKIPALTRLVAAGLVDAIEILNARMALRSHNRRGAHYALGAGLPGTAGSDGHSRPEYARAWIEIAPFANRDEFVANLAEATVGGGLSLFYVHFLSTVAKRRKKWQRTS